MYKYRLPLDPAFTHVCLPASRSRSCALQRKRHKVMSCIDRDGVPLIVSVRAGAPCAADHIYPLTGSAPFLRILLSAVATSRAVI